MRIDGKKIAQEIVEHLKNSSGSRKFLAIIFVGNNKASESFIKQKEKFAHAISLEFKIYHFQEDITEDSLKNEIKRIAEDPMCGGLVVQLPLPPHIHREHIVGAIPLEKDVDILSEDAFHMFKSGESKITPPAVGAFCKIVERHLGNNDLREKKIAVLGAGFLVGRPIATYCMGKCTELFILDKGANLLILKEADIVVLGAGAPNIVQEQLIKKNALVIDFGCSFVNGKLCGDLEEPTGEEFSYTPTPGGTGPVLVAQLFENFFKLNK